MVTALELYEALKPTVGEEAARMMAEVLPLTEAVATKSHLDARLSALEARIFRWMLGFFATLWVGNVALIVTIVLKF
jgi:hypothetical protein